MKRNQGNGWLLPAISSTCAGIAILAMIAAAPVRATEFVLAELNGDANASGTRDITDAVYLLTYLFRGGPEPVPLGCEPYVAVFRGVEVHNGDVNGGGINVADPVYLLVWLFAGGPEPIQGCPPTGV